MELRKYEGICNLSDCPVGLFVELGSGELCLKTEYGNNNGGCECYIVSSGERLSCNGKTATYQGCDLIMVQPYRV